MKKAAPMRSSSTRERRSEAKDEEKEMNRWPEEGKSSLQFVQSSMPPPAPSSAPSNRAPGKSDSLRQVLTKQKANGSFPMDALVSFIEEDSIGDLLATLPSFRGII
jgi:hypothetical protein